MPNIPPLQHGRGDPAAPGAEVVVLGAGLAGLAAAWAVDRAGYAVKVLERDAQLGGLARTIEHDGYRFDLGGHRFLTDDPQVQSLVEGLLGADLLTVQRSSKTLVAGKYVDYPLRPANALLAFGPGATAAIVQDYLRERLRQRLRPTPIVNLRDWVTANFGQRLFELYFRDYSEKVWGVDCSEIAMEWIAQRIEGLSLGRAIRDALFGGRTRQRRTETAWFQYPRLGIGQIAQRLASAIEQREQRIALRTEVVSLQHRQGRIESVASRCGGRDTAHCAAQVVSSLPLPLTVRLLAPAAPKAVLEQAAGLRFRDLVVVALSVNRPRVTSQTWLYYPQPEICFGRLHEPTNWSPAMAPAGHTLLVTEHFCFRGDAAWSASDSVLIERTATDLVSLGLIEASEVLGAKVVRVPNAYPIFDVGFAARQQALLRFLGRFENLHTVGRGGEFRYLNTDHAMASGLRVAAVIAAQLGSAEAASRARASV